MTYMQPFPDQFYRKLPENLRAIMGGNNLRLLDASEVFYENVPNEWEWLIENTQVKIKNPPIPYFASFDFRACGEHWWLRSVASPSCFALVNGNGIADFFYASVAFGVRPAFTIY